MTRIHEIGGQRFGMLVALERAGSVKGKAQWKCLCDCGASSVASGDNLRRGIATSCGCRKRAALDATKFKARHGLSDTRVHLAWMSMRQRCENPNATGYSDYGGRGIKVCQRWQTFENFFADMGHPPAGHELDRKDVNGNYEPGNCRWLDVRAQARNKRNTVLVEHDGRTQSLRAWADETGIKFHTLYRRIVLRKESPATALTRRPL